jgi:hypothetical protein
MRRITMAQLVILSVSEREHAAAAIQHNCKVATTRDLNDSLQQGNGMSSKEWRRAAYRGTYFSLQCPQRSGSDLVTRTVAR